MLGYSGREDWLSPPIGLMWRTEPVLPTSVCYRRFPGVALGLVSEALSFSEYASRDVDDSIVWNAGFAGRFSFDGQIA